MKASIEHFVLTGATGFIGSHLAIRMLQDDTAELTLLIRGKNVDEARERVVQRLRGAARAARSSWDELSVRRRIHVLVGDVTASRCGVAEAQLGPARARGTVEFWHAAASLNFDESCRQQIEEHNVDGARHALELAQALGAKRFVHVSTAYVAGTMSGHVPEALFTTDRPFNNAYERSKCSGERIVDEFCGRHGIEHHILRPSIVIGDSRSYSPAGSDSGLYGFLREMLRIRRALAAAPRPIQLVAEADAPVNLVPVDWLASEMLALRERGFGPGTIHHLTARDCPTVGGTLDAICDALEVPRFMLVSELSGNISPLEGLLSRRMAFYASYLSGARVFERAAPTTVDVAAHELPRYVRGYLRERADRNLPFESSELEARDGFPLRTASAVRGARETVVLVNALGMPRTALEKLEHALSEHHDVLTWESRGAPSLAGELFADRAAFARHADDLEDVLAQRGVGPVHVVGWCSGADVALDFALRDPSRVRSLVCLNGPFVGASSLRTPYQLDLERIVRRAAQSREHAALFHGLIGQLLAAPASCAGSESGASVQRALSVLEPDVMHFTGAPLQSVASFHRYCVLLRRYFDEAPAQLYRIGVPALLVCAGDDAIAHPGASSEAAARLGATLRQLPGGGHFAACRDEALVESVVAFLRAHRADQLSTASGPTQPSDRAA